MTIQERVQEVFNRFNVNLTVSEESRTEMAEAALENGTVIYTDADSFVEGVEAYIINDEGEKIPLPPGEYTLASGGMITVGEGGVVSSVSGPEAPAEEPAQEVQAEETEDEPSSEEESPAYVTRDEVESMIAAALESLGKKDKEEMSAVNPEAPKAEKAVAEVVEEVVEEKEDAMAVELAAVKAELEAIKKLPAEGGLKHKAPTVKREPLNLKNLTTEERVRALANHFNA